MLSYTVIFSMSGRVSGRKVPVIISERKGHDTRIQYQQSCRLWQNISFIWYHHFWKYLPQVYMNCCLNCPSFDLNPQKGYVLETLGFSHDDRNTKCCAYMMARVQMCASPVLYFTISRIFCGQQESMCNVCMHWMYWNLGWVPFVPSFFSPLFFIITNQIFLFYFSATLQRTSCGIIVCTYAICVDCFFFPSVQLFVPYWAILAILSQILPWKPNSVTSQHSIFLLLDWLLIGKHMSTSLSLWSCSESALWLMSVFINDEFKCSLLPPPRGFQRLPSYLKIQ